MHKIKMFFLLTFFIKNITCMESAIDLLRVNTNVEQPQHALWIDNGKILIAGKGFEVVDIENNTPTKSCISEEKVHDIAVMEKIGSWTSKPQYAVSLPGNIKCFDKDNNEFYSNTLKQKSYIPICFKHTGSLTCYVDPKCNDQFNAYLTAIGSRNKIGPVSLANTTMLTHAIPQEPQKQYLYLTNTTTNVLEKFDILEIKQREDRFVLDAKFIPGTDNIIVNRGDAVEICNSKKLIPGYQMFTSYYIAFNEQEEYAYTNFEELPHECARTKSFYTAFDCNSTHVFLLTGDNVVQAYNFVLKKLISEVSLQFIAQNNITETGKRLSISPDNNNLLVTLQNSCCIIPFTAFMLNQNQ